jgi:putative ABC transport system substrate-binding protein
VVGFLHIGVREKVPQLTAFQRGLHEAGFMEGQNVLIEYRWAEEQYERLPTMATDLVGRRVSVLVAADGLSARAAKAATTTIPTVFYVGSDPVGIGLVASLNRPGGNLTGMSGLSVELEPKRLELLHELLPTATNIAALVNSANPNAEKQSKDLQAAADTLGLHLQVLRAATERDFDEVFSTLVQLRAGALIVGGDPMFTSRGEQLAALAAHHAIPVIYQQRDNVVAGGLMSYGGSLTDAFSRIGAYTGRILKGEKPADLPVVQSSKFEFVINLRTAKTLGLEFHPQLLATADEVIE